jgi:hypothetical protein
MIERLSTYDKVLLGGALVMASGTLFPILRLPIVGSFNYIAGGKGDGVVVLIIAGAIVFATLYEYRRIAAVLGLIAMGVMAHSLIGIFVILAKARAEPLPKNNPFKGLGDLLISSVGIEWGWVPLIGGALAVVMAGFMSSSTTSFGSMSKLAGGASSDTVDPEKADTTIAMYLASQKRSAIKANESGMPTFGKRSN